MKTVSVLLPPDVYEGLKERAKRQRRSLRSEIAILLSQIAANDPTMQIKLRTDARAIR